MRIIRARRHEVLTAAAEDVHYYRAGMGIKSALCVTILRCWTRCNGAHIDCRDKIRAAS
jgi:hypothetical protein